jgi:5'-3' exonuclease
MGIENFFLYLKSNKNLNKNITDKTTNKFDYIYIDINSVICKTIETFEQELNYVNYEIIYNKHLNQTEFSDKAKEIIELYNIDITNIRNNLDVIFVIMLKKNINLIFNEFDVDFVKIIYIAYDGIPTMAKIVEQRRRKYTKYIIDEIKERIYKKYESSIDIIRKEFEENRIKITLNCKFNIEDIIKNMCNNVSLIISDKNEIGEGEKKIFEHITTNYSNSSYLIISPDSDVIILSLLHQNLMSLMSIESSYHIIKNIDQIEYINIDKIRLNLIEYVLNRIEKFKIEERNFIPNTSNIISDIIVLIQFLGNDFIPRLNTLISKTSLTILIDIYIRHISRTKNKFKYLVFNENNIFKLNYENLNSIIYKLSENEHKLLYETFCANNYKNFNYLLSIFDVNDESPFFYDKLLSYIYGFNKIITYIIANKNTDKTGKDIYDSVVNKYLDRDIFMKVFISIESDTNFISNNLVFDFIEILDKIVINIKTNKYYKGKLRFIKYSLSINDSYHLQNIINNLEHPKMSITDYDKNYYKFEKRLDEYYYILSSDVDSKLGYIDVNFKNNYYKILNDINFEIHKKNFYQEKIKTFEPDKIKNICNSYLLGLFWNFDFYFNKNNHQKNCETISIWYYEQDIVPFLTDLQFYMKEMTNKTHNRLFYQIINDTSQFYVTKNNYLTDTEQYIYVTPNEKLYEKIPERYNELLLNKNIFPDIRNIIEEILDGNVTKHLNLTNCTYINKCKILGLNIISYNELIKNFIRLRN